MSIIRLKSDFQIENDKGFFVQLVHEGWKQINVLKSTKGATRGGHYHKENKEAFYVVEGKVQLVLEKADEKEELFFAERDFFLIEPYQKHTFTFLEDTIMVSMYNFGVEQGDGSKDIYKE